MTGRPTMRPDQIHRLCVFDLSLSCGHIATVAVDGWYPVSLACCDRLGGYWIGGTFYAMAAAVEYANCLSERYEQRPLGAARDPLRVLDRRPRIDEPLTPLHRWQQPSGGRFPVRVGAAVGSPPEALVRGRGEEAGCC